MNLRYQLCSLEFKHTNKCEYNEYNFHTKHLGLSPANAISIEVDNEPIITTDRSSSAENTKEQNDLESKKDVEIIYGSSSTVSSSFEDNTATTLSSSSNNPKNQRVPRIQTFTVGQDGTLPSKSK